MNKKKQRSINLCNKMREEDNPYEIWKLNDWEWRVLKKWQSPDNEAKNPYARWFCAVKSPFTYDSYELGDVYAAEIKASGAVKTWDWQTHQAPGKGAKT